MYDMICIIHISARIQQHACCFDNMFGNALRDCCQWRRATLRSGDDDGLTRYKMFVFVNIEFGNIFVIANMLV